MLRVVGHPGPHALERSCRRCRGLGLGGRGPGGAGRGHGQRSPLQQPSRQPEDQVRKNTAVGDERAGAVGGAEAERRGLASSPFGPPHAQGFHPMFHIRVMSPRRPVPTVAPLAEARLLSLFYSRPTPSASQGLRVSGPRTNRARRRRRKKKKRKKSSRCVDRRARARGRPGRCGSGLAWGWSWEPPRSAASHGPSPSGTRSRSHHRSCQPDGCGPVHQAVVGIRRSRRWQLPSVPQG
jgi:hypothetical protein